MSHITMLTGGSRSGKSTHALELASKYKNKAFIATAQPFDGEMEERVQKHKEERGDDFLTLEEPISVATAILKASKSADVVVVDCLTVWIGNLMHHFEDEYPAYKQIEEFYAALSSASCDLIIVTNELGMGLIPSTSMGRKFRDLAGRVNQNVAKISDSVSLVVSTLPLKLK